MKKLVLAALLVSLVVPVAVADVTIPEVYWEFLGFSFYTPLYNLNATPFMYNWNNGETLIGAETKVLAFPSKDIEIGAGKIPKEMIDIDFGGAGNGIPSLTVDSLFPYLGANISMLSLKTDSGIIDYLGLWAGHDFREKHTGRVFNAIGFKASHQFWGK